MRVLRSPITWALILFAAALSVVNATTTNPDDYDFRLTVSVTNTSSASDWHGPIPVVLETANLISGDYMNSSGSEVLLTNAGNIQDGGVLHPTGSTSTWWWYVDAPSGLTSQVNAYMGSTSTSSNTLTYLDFDATDDVITVSDVASIQNVYDGGGSGEAWIYPRSAGEATVGTIMAKGNGTTTGWRVNTSNEAAGFMQVELTQHFTGTLGQWRTSVAQVPINQWSHIAWTYNASSTASNPIFYRNGTVINITELSAPVGTRVSDVGSDLYIGDTAISVSSADGFIDNVRLWSDIRTATEILDNKDVELTGSETDLEGYWPLGVFLEEGSSGARDLTSNANHGAIAGASWAFAESATGRVTGTRNIWMFPFGNHVTSTRIEIAGDASLDISDDLTVRAEVRVQQLPATTTIAAAKRDSYGIFVSTSTILGRVYFATTTPEVSFSPVSLATNYTVAMTLSSNNLQLYVDGLLVDSAVTSGTITLNANSVFIGEGLTGSIDRVLIGHTSTSTPTFVVDHQFEPSDLTENTIGNVSNDYTWSGTSTNSDIGGNNGIYYIYASTSPLTITAGPLISLVSPLASVDFAQRSNWFVDVDTSLFTVSDYVIFDGIDDYVQVTDATPIQEIFDNGGTIEAWIYIRSAGENNSGRIVDKTEWELQISSAAVPADLQFRYLFTGFQGIWLTNSGALPLNAWAHVAIAYDSSDVANDPIIYVDGVSIPVVTIVSPTGTANLDAGDDLIIGNNVTTIFAYDGYLDDVRVWDRIRTPTEISSSYQRELTGNDAGLVGYWKFNDGIEGVARDSSFSDNDGVISGALFGVTSPVLPSSRFPFTELVGESALAAGISDEALWFGIFLAIGLGMGALMAKQTGFLLAGILAVPLVLVMGVAADLFQPYLVALVSANAIGVYALDALQRTGGI